jgi:biopolymer transport protein ExbD
VKFARRTRQEVDVNLTPLIDVVFLLLIFFMVSTTFTKETELSIDLPEAEGLTSRLSDKQIEISITREGDYAINGVALINRDRDTLNSAIAKVSEGDSKLPLIITADSATPHQSVVTALDVSGHLGFTRISITTQLTRPDDQ